jgi:hypothetical protein
MVGIRLGNQLKDPVGLSKPPLLLIARLLLRLAPPADSVQAPASDVRGEIRPDLTLQERNDVFESQLNAALMGALNDTPGVCAESIPISHFPFVSLPQSSWYPPVKRIGPAWRSLNDRETKSNRYKFRPT